MVQILLILLVALVVIGGGHYYLWRRLVHDTTRPGTAARRAGTVAIPSLAALTVAALIGGRSLPIEYARFLAWPGYLWLALTLYLFLALLAGELLRPLLTAAHRRRSRAREAAPHPAPAGAPAPDNPASDNPASDNPAGQTPAPAGQPTAENATPPGKTAPAEPTAATSPAAEPPTAGSPANESPIREPAAREPAAPEPAAPEPAAPEPAAPHPDDLPRRLFVGRSVALGATLAATATVGYGMHTALAPPRLKKLTVPLAKLDPRAHGFRIAVVSDIHLGPISGRSHTRRIVDIINRTSPDLVAIVGDLVDGSTDDLGSAAQPLADLRARHGSFFVTGNHEYFSGAREWVEYVRDLGVRPLENERVEIDGFDLAGVNDVAGEDEGEGPDFAKALGGRDPSRASVLLAHQPVQVHEAADHGVDLQLSGHTHGGQMWPGSLVAGLANPTVAGLERHEDTQLYVTRGAGFWGPPVRVGAPPDITVVTLASPRA